MIKQKYGVVYTPDSLAQFVAALLKRTAESSSQIIRTVLDPSSGECALLNAAKKAFGTECAYIGIDVDREAVNATKDSFTIIHNDTILPQNVKRKAADYWRGKLPEIDAIIANPPWSSEKIYDRSELNSSGYTLASGQYDSYVLFFWSLLSICCVITEYLHLLSLIRYSILKTKGYANSLLKKRVLE